jgi:hypothetical protein
MKSMNENSSRSYDFLWLSFTTLTLVTLSFLFTIQPQDYWWCLRVGHETLLDHAVPTIESFSWRQAGHSINYQPWLSCVAFWLAYDLGGVSLTYLLRALLIGLTYGLIWFMAREESGPRAATILVLLMGFATSNNWQVRTQLFAYPLFALCLFCITNWQKGNNKFLWFLPVATILWANLHGSFILSLVLAGTAFVFGNGDRKALSIAIFLIMAGTLLNPHGFGTWQHLDFMLTSPSDQLFSIEWFPPRNEGWQLNIFFAWALGFAPLASLSSKKTSAMEWVLFLGFGWLAFSGIRYVIWFLFIVSALTARHVADLTKGKLDGVVKLSFPAINIMLACFFLTLSLLYMPGIREKWWSEAPPVYAPDTTPIAAVEWLTTHPELPHPLWNDFAFGSYLTFALPSRPVGMDGRFFVYPPEEMDKYQRVSHDLPEWESLLERDGVNLLLLSFVNQSSLIKNVETSNQWCEQYRDETAVIFSRCNPIQ